MDRAQQRLALVLIPLSYFVHGWRGTDEEEPVSTKPLTIHEEFSDVWVNVSLFNFVCVYVRASVSNNS